jgi:hypothetical protein
MFAPHLEIVPLLDVQQLLMWFAGMLTYFEPRKFSPNFLNIELIVSIISIINIDIIFCILFIIFYISIRVSFVTDICAVKFARK